MPSTPRCRKLTTPSESPSPLFDVAGRPKRGILSLPSRSFHLKRISDEPEDDEEEDNDNMKDISFPNCSASSGNTPPRKKQRSLGSSETVIKEEHHDRSAAE